MRSMHFFNSDPEAVIGRNNHLAMESGGEVPFLCSIVKGFVDLWKAPLSL